MYWEISIKNAERARQSFSNSFLLNGKRILPTCISNKLIYVTCEEECLFIFAGSYFTVNHLFSIQDEVDTRLLLYAYDASLNYQDIIIHTPDTDVFTLVITMWVIEARIFIKPGKQGKLRLVHVEKMVKWIDYVNKAGVCNAFLSYMSSLAVILQVRFTVMGRWKHYEQCWNIILWTL